MTYDPNVGQFVSLDPCESLGENWTPLMLGGAPDPTNSYRYGGNDPVDEWDPTGLDKVKTGVEIRRGYLKGDWIWDSISSHSYIVVDGVGYGRYELHNNATGSAVIRNNDATVYPKVDPSTVAKGDPYSTSTEIVIDDCQYDAAKFKDGILDYLAKETSAPGVYIAGIRDCDAFVQAAINAGYDAARKTNLTPPRRDFFFP